MPDPITHSTNAVLGGTIGAMVAAIFGVSISVVFSSALGAILAVALLHKFSLKIGFLIIIAGTASASFLTPWLHDFTPRVAMEGIGFFVAAGGITFWGQASKAISAKIEALGAK